MTPSINQACPHCWRLFWEQEAWRAWLLEAEDALWHCDGSKIVRGEFHVGSIYEDEMLTLALWAPKGGALHTADMVLTVVRTCLSTGCSSASADFVMSGTAMVDWLFEETEETWEHYCPPLIDNPSPQRYEEARLHNEQEGW